MKALPTMAEEASDAGLRDGFTQHLEQTGGQVRRIDDAFAALGEPANAEQCPGIEGVIEEHDAFMQEEKKTLRSLEKAARRLAKERARAERTAA